MAQFPMERDETEIKSTVNELISDMSGSAYIQSTKVVASNTPSIYYSGNLVKANNISISAGTYNTSNSQFVTYDNVKYLVLATFTMANAEKLFKGITNKSNVRLIVGSALAYKTLGNATYQWQTVGSIYIYRPTKSANPSNDTCYYISNFAQSTASSPEVVFDYSFVIVPMMAFVGSAGNEYQHLPSPL